MPTYSIGQAAHLPGLSPETAPRWADGGRLRMGRDGSGNRVIDGMGLARFAKQRALAGVHGVPGHAPPTSVHHALTGIVTALTVDDVVARVEVQAGPTRWSRS
ncbi:MerR family transcriptional regulator [Streptomyces sp. NPDC086776]|uniref:MerR family transcriptional regulator n=2 Tax=Streptomyces TaxID=1883 RepID=UPI0038274579